MALLEVKNLYKELGNQIILNDISFSLDKGKTLSIIGTSGSGKTTLLRCLNFLELADKGSICLNNEEIYNGELDKNMKENDLRSLRKHFGLVFQQFNLFPQYTALENVTIAGKLMGNEDIERGKQLLAMMGLQDRMNYYPHQLSGGQQQRVAIARALSLNPEVLCFDEPTSALDPLLTNEVLKVIKDLANNKTTMIIVTHEIKFARDVSDEIIYLDSGVIAEAGKDIIDNPKDPRTINFLKDFNE